LLMKNYGFKLEYTDKQTSNNLIIIENVSPAQTSSEAYNLKVDKKTITIGGAGETGQFYALQTLMQMLPVEFKGEAKIPAVNITDSPRFGYRGMHLDVSRHFMPVSFVKKYIDLMSQYKFNQFHWHLTDDQGWRIEIKKYPRLTEIGSKRPQSHEGKYSPVFKGDGRPVEGFYTQEEIKDVVAYAKARKINVIPEIELPGHATAALAAYPELGEGCKENYDYQVKMTWGIFKEVFCPTDKTFQFLEDVLAETIALFPDSPYVHIGGDEVLKDFWKDSAFVQELKRKENLKDEHEVQSYFVRRIEKFVNSKGKKIIGWDEILEGGVAPNATIMSWRGEKGGIESARAKHDVIMTPNTYLYLDYGQGDPKYEPLNIGGFISLEKVYSYNPIPKELSADEAKYILGAQANIWTEYLETPAAVEYMAFPRMIALSEVNWSPNETKNYTDFLRRMKHQYQMLDKQNVNYRIPAPEGLQNIILKDSDKAKIELKPQISNAKIFYTLDGSEPTAQSKQYEKPLEINLKQGETVELKTIIVNEKGRKSSVYAATVLRREPLKPIELSNKNEGVNFRFYKGDFNSVNNFASAPPAETGMTKSILLNQFSDKTNKFKNGFGMQFDGYIYAPEDAIYEFEIDAKDGATLEIGGEKIIDLDGRHARQLKTAIIPLAKGYHKITLRNFQSGGEDSFLSLRRGVKGTGLQRMYGGEFFR
jgi:hexosaminidase